MLSASVALAVAAAAACSGGEAKSGPARETPGPAPGASAPPPAAPAVSAPAFGPGVHDFTLPTSLGGPVSLREYLGQKNVVLVFYRGFW